jgi:hypothetical protein
MKEPYSLSLFLIPIWLDSPARDQTPHFATFRATASDTRDISNTMSDTFSSETFPSVETFTCYDRRTALTLDVGSCKHGVRGAKTVWLSVFVRVMCL